MFALGQRVDAERSGASSDQIEKDEAKQDGRHAAILRRVKALRRMAQEIGESHQARQYKGGNARLEADQHKEAEREFEQAGNPG